MSTSRRNFIKGFGLAGIALAGVAGYKEAKERIVYKQDEVPTAELEKQLEKKPVLQLQVTYGEEVPPETIYNSNSFCFVGVGPRYKPGTEKLVKVDLAPGPDGKLYVKENDSWRKI